MAEASGFERLLRRDRAITIAGVGLLCVLAWLYLFSGAGMGASSVSASWLFAHQRAAPETMDMPGMDMSGMDMGGMDTGAAAATRWTPGVWTLMIAMWWVMMIAMMTPSAAPTILLYARVHRHGQAQGGVEEAFAPTGVFAAGYLSVWLAFSLAAAALTWTLEQVHLVSAALMGSQSRWLSAGVLVAAGLYQLSPLKTLCLEHCRTPASFLTRHWRPGAAGAFRLGALHGAYCVGCCWALMALLFVGGVMNLLWIAALTLLVLAEKTLPGGRWIGRGAGVVLLALGAASLLL